MIGIVSDTHGTLAPGVLAALEGVERILHAGDVGGSDVIERLTAVAPVVAVRGNMDLDASAWRLAEQASVTVGTTRILVVHDGATRMRAGLPDGVSILVSGHTHRARIQMRAGVLHINPGSAGGRNRDGRGPTVALLDTAAQPPVARIVEL